MNEKYKSDDILKLYNNYLHTLDSREKYGEKYGDTLELIKMYENKLTKYGIRINNKKIN